MDLRDDNEARIAVLTLRSKLILELDNCYFILALLETSYPFLNRFKFIIKGKCCSFYNNDVYYGFGTYQIVIYTKSWNAQVHYKWQ
jgi:hypothetical protein